jgi:hypothetical protein
MPILRKNNEELVARLGSTQEEVAQLKSVIGVQTQALADLTAFQAAEVKRQVAAQVTTLRRELAEARAEGTTEEVVALEVSLDEAKDRLKDVSAPAKANAPAPAPAKPTPVDPEAQAFAEANTAWFGKDRKRTAVFAAALDELHSTGMRGKALFDSAKAEMETVFAPIPTPDKAEGGGRGSSTLSTERVKTFRDLPSDAKAQCQVEERKMVGVGKPFKDAAGWQAHYANVYFGE